MTCFAAQWLAGALPCRRFATILADDNARLGAEVGRYAFLMVDSQPPTPLPVSRRTQIKSKLSQFIISTVGALFRCGGADEQEIELAAAVDLRLPESQFCDLAIAPRLRKSLDKVSFRVAHLWSLHARRVGTGRFSIALYLRSSCSKYAIVRLRPVRSGVFGCQSRSALASAMSGQR
jgi:hypothetical protein